MRKGFTEEMTGLARCLMPPHALATLDDPFHYMAFEAAILLSNTLLQFVVAAMAYTMWQRRDAESAKLATPLAVLCGTTLIAMALKYLIKMRHGNALPLDCCLGHVLSLDYTMPSIHAMAVVLLAIYASGPYWRAVLPIIAWLRRRQVESPDPEAAAAAATNMEDDEEEPMSPEDLRDSRIRLLIIWLYVLLLCYSRIALRLNSIWDVLVGLAIGIGATVAFARLSQLLCVSPIAVAMKNE